MSLCRNSRVVSCNKISEWEWDRKQPSPLPPPALFPYRMSFENWIFAGNYSCLKVNLSFTRDRSFYFTTFFIPGIILVTSSFITFWLEWNAVPARSMIGKHTDIHTFMHSTRENGKQKVLLIANKHIIR